MNSISERILFARERSGISQEDLADRVGVSRTSVSAWERGASEPRGINLLRLANALEVRQAWLKTGESPITNEAVRLIGADGMAALESEPETDPGRIPMAALVQEATLSVDRACARRGMTLDAVRRARVVAALFTRARMANQIPTEDWAAEEIMRPER